jgi:hypothetical protein
MGLASIIHKVTVVRETKEVFEVVATDIAHAHQLMRRQLDLLDYELVGKVFKRLRHVNAKYRIEAIEFSVTDTKETDEADQADLS